MSEDDFNLFPLLHSLSIVAVLTLPDNVEAYSNRLTQHRNVPLLFHL